MRTHVLLPALLTAAAGLTGAAVAQMVVPLERYYYELKPSDLQLMGTEIDQLLDTGREGSTASWRNDQTGNTGIIRLERRFQRDGTPCRTIVQVIRLRTEADPRQLRLTYCRFGDRWEVIR